MNELNWKEHREQLSRQLKWQEVRNDFYGNICCHSKNAAAAARAGAAKSLDARRMTRIGDRIAECGDAHTFYNKVVLPHDAAIKQAAFAGDAAIHVRLLDEANDIIQGMHQHTHLALSHEEI